MRITSVGFIKKDVKISTINMLTELKKTIIKEVKECIMTMLHQIGNHDKGIEGIKKSQMEILELKSAITEIIL